MRNAPFVSSVPTYPFWWMQAVALWLAVTLVFILSAPVANAQSVSINRGSGQGYAVRFRGNCYLLLPDHVRGRSPRLSISVGAPPVTGEATVFHSFAPEKDLAVAHVRGDLQGRCSKDFASLPSSIDAILDRSEKAFLLRVQTTGQITRTGVSIVEILYDTLRVTVDEGQDELYQGTSGSFLFVDDIPVGMMIEAPDGMNGTALRLDAITDRTRRLLQGGPASGNERMVSEPEAVRTGLPMADIACSVEPESPEARCSNLLSGAGSFIAAAPGDPVVIDVELAPAAGNKAQVVQSIDLASSPDDASGPPKSIRVHLDSSTGPVRRWRAFGSADMSPLGDYHLSSGSGQFARRVRITIETAWHPDKPMRLDRIVLR